MTDPFSDRYWIEEFQVTKADLDRIAAHIREASQARDLTALAQRIVRGRLIHGPETASIPARPAWAEDPSVRLWDPLGEWSEGDHTIVAVRFQEGNRTWYEPFAAEVIGVGTNQVTVYVVKGDKKFINSNKGIKVVETLDAAGGLAIESKDGKVRIDSTINSLFEYMKPDLRKKIFDMLYG